MATSRRRAKPSLTEEELAQCILGLAEYESSGQREKDGYTYHETSVLRGKLKMLANERFQSNWLILEDDEDDTEGMG